MKYLHLFWIATVFLFFSCNKESGSTMNLPPGDITLSNKFIDEDQPSGTLIGTLKAADPDNTQHQFSLVTGKNDDKFRINDPGLNQPLDLTTVIRINMIYGL